MSNAPTKKLLHARQAVLNLQRALVELREDGIAGQVEAIIVDTERRLAVAQTELAVLEKNLTARADYLEYRYGL